MQGIPDGQRVTFGGYAFDLRLAILFKDGSWIRVPDQSLKVLAALLENPGAIITREELARRIWPNGTHVEFDQGLNSVVKRLRAALLDSSTTPRYIETLPKRGYRFIYPVEQAPLTTRDSEPLSSEPGTRQGPAAVSRGSKLLVAGSSRRIVTLLVFLFVSACAAMLYDRAHSRASALDQAILLAQSLTARGDFGSAYDLATAAAPKLPADDPRVERLWQTVSQKISIASDPPGAAVFWRPYAGPKSPWRFLGATPLLRARVSAGAVRLRLIKPGYTDLEIAAREPKYRFQLESAGTHAGMVHIPAGPVFAQYAGIGRLGPITLGDFWIDRTEVTNSEFQEFVKAGGYGNRQHWQFPFIENGHQLTWKQAMAKFTDRTGYPSPASWSVGAYPPGKGKYPVSGVSWYEAAAYAHFAGKALPTVYEWFRAAHTDDSAFMIRLSNFNGRGPVPVETKGALGSLGLYDMAGNVREWCFNQSGGMRFILGGAWSDPTYMFTRGQRLPPLDRSVTNGLRCVKSVGAIALQPQLAGPISPPVFDRAILTPVSDEVFESSRSLYAHDHTDLHPKLQSVTDSEMWRREKVLFRAGYANEEVIAYLFLPKQRRPPYECVVLVPSADAFQARTGDTIQPLDYILASGRAIIYPIFWGTFDRFVNLPSDPANGGYPSPMFIREALIAWKKDFGRTLDYLQGRQDIGQIGYLGASTGAEFGPVLLAGEERVKAAVLLSGAMPVQMKLMPESNPVNFTSHVTIPVLMLNGRYDSILIPDAQDWMFRALGTAAQNKAHVLVDSGHGVFAPEVRNETIQQTLKWFDRYLGPR